MLHSCDFQTICKWRLLELGYFVKNYKNHRIRRNLHYMYFAAFYSKVAVVLHLFKDLCKNVNITIEQRH